MKTRQRGNTGGWMMLGMVGMIVLLFTFCASILYSSLDSYRAAKMGEWRLQARAAAEGAAVALQRNPVQAPATLEIGPCRVKISAVNAEGADYRARFTVETLGPGRVAGPAWNYDARFAPAAGGGWMCARLEAAP